MRGGRRGLVLATLAAVVAIAATGCGGSSNNNSSGFSPYETKMLALDRSLSATFLSQAKFEATASKAGIVKTLRNTQTLLRSTAVKLDNITPPSGAAAGHALLIKGVREYADELDGVIAKVQRGNLRAPYEINNLRGIHDMNKATEEITKAGYVIAIH
jgi:hypothetical protein